jgi:hypothetical protein
MRLARDFVRGIGGALSEQALRELEEWLQDFQDDWSAPKELERPEVLPSSFGLTAYRLLSELPETRISGTAYRRLGELRRKFNGKVIDTEREPHGGHITSAVPDRIADRWSVREWNLQIKKAATKARSSIFATWHERGEHMVGVFTLGQLTAQLERLASAAPCRYVSLAREFDAATPAKARKAVLTGIATHTAPDHYADAEPWERLDDETLAEVLIRPEYLNEPELERRLTWIIDQRAVHRWPDVVIDRIESISRADVSAALELPDERELLIYRMNEISSWSIQTMGRLAKHHPSLRSRVLSLVRDFAHDEDPGRRASAAAAAICCYEHDPRAVTDIFLAITVDPRIAAEQDIVGPLLWFAERGEDKETRTTAAERLTSLSTSKNRKVAETGGSTTVLLRHRGIIDDEKLNEILASNVEARRGAAAQVEGILTKPAQYSTPDEPPQWLIEVVLRLANDPDETVGERVIFGVAHGQVERLIRRPEVFKRLVESPAGTHNLSIIIEGCDRAAELLPLADRIIELAAAAGRTHDDSLEYWRRYENTRRAVNALARLVEESERESCFDVRTRALDAWDQLIMAGEPQAQTAFDRRIINGEIT